MKNMLEITFRGGRLQMLLAKPSLRMINRISQKFICLQGKNTMLRGLKTEGVTAYMKISQVICRLWEKSSFHTTCDNNTFQRRMVSCSVYLVFALS